jgi:hypothetical protein
MNYKLNRRLQDVRSEYYAARAALAYVAEGWARLHDEPVLLGQNYSALHSAVTNLEATYTARLFAEFEAILRGQYPYSRPGNPVPDNSDGLIGGLGTRYRIPVGERDNVHRVRRFRHSVAHADSGAEPISFVDALSWLNQYLARIDDDDVP